MRVENDYLESLSDTIYRRYVGAALQLHQRDDTIAFRHGSLADAESKLSEAADALRREPSTKTETCVCCYREVAMPEALRCDAEVRHAFCRACVDAQCRARREMRCNIPTSTLVCMSTEECAGLIRIFKDMPHFERYFCDYALGQAMPYVLKHVGENTTPRALSLMRSDGTFLGLQCSECGYGPMWNENCSELITHHNQEIGEGRIDNSCPWCGNFAHDVSLMARWDGNGIEVDELAV